MTDRELAEFICPNDVEKGLRAVPNISASERAVFEQMDRLLTDVSLWDAGLGPKPTYARICGPREIREGRGPRRPR